MLKLDGIFCFLLSQAIGSYFLMRDVSVLNHKPWALLMASGRKQCASKGCSVAVTGLLSQSEYSSVVTLLLQTVNRNVIRVLIPKSHQSSSWCRHSSLNPMHFETLVGGVTLLFACPLCKRCCVRQ